MTDHVAVFFAPHTASESGFLWERGRREGSPECRAAGLLHLSRGHFPSTRAPEGGVRPICLPASIIQMRERKRRALLCQHSMSQVKLTVSFPSHCPTGWWGHKCEKRLQKLWCDFSHRDCYRHVRDTGEKYVRRDICTLILCKLLSCSPVNIPVPRIFPMMTAGCSCPWEEDGCFLLWVWKCCSWKRGGWEIQRESSHVMGAGGLPLPALKTSPNWYQGCRHYVKGRSKSINITQSCFQTGKSNHPWTLAKYM